MSRIFVATITASGVSTRTIESIRAAEKLGLIQDWHLELCGPYLDDGRNRCVEAYAKTDCEKLLFVDSDVAFEPEDIIKLDEVDVGVVSGIYCNLWSLGDRHVPEVRPVALRWRQTEDGWHLWPVQIRDVAGHGLIEMDGVGAGFLMITREVLTHFAKEYEAPTQFFVENVVNGVHMGEDVGFCRRAQELGYHIWLHQDVLLPHYKTVCLKPQRSWMHPVTTPSDNGEVASSAESIQ